MPQRVLYHHGCAIDFSHGFAGELSRLTGIARIELFGSAFHFVQGLTESCLCAGGHEKGFLRGVHQALCHARCPGYRTRLVQREGRGLVAAFRLIGALCRAFLRLG